MVKLTCLMLIVHLSLFSQISVALPVRAPPSLPNALTVRKRDDDIIPGAGASALSRRSIAGVAAAAAIGFVGAMVCCVCGKPACQCTRQCCEDCRDTYRRQAAQRAAAAPQPEGDRQGYELTPRPQAPDPSQQCCEGCSHPNAGAPHEQGYAVTHQMEAQQPRRPDAVATDPRPKSGHWFGSGRKPNEPDSNVG
ncbi:hypothetical protein AX14_011640 [Amanita brunnescens Koide BX004]|nr:hypothetical protein AX14_011640 [Amanita brunnescens Koide BX004]